MSVHIADREIADYRDPYVIAEIGANHNGDMDLARRLILEAKNCGCDCVKFQSWTAETIFSAKNYRDNFFYKDDYRQRSDYTLQEIVDAFSLGEVQLAALKEYSDSLGLDFSSSVFSRREADFLLDVLKCPFVKIASMDVTNLPFLEYVASKGAPVVLSTGMSTVAEVDEAVRAMEQQGNRRIVLLHCVSNYPPVDEDIHLNNMLGLRAAYPDYPVGYSDHSLGSAVSIASAALGACVIEKHFTLDRGMFGWDHAVSADPAEMRALVEGARRAHKALGSTRRRLTEEDARRHPAYRRSIVAAREIPAGHRLAEEDLDFKRPGTGISPAEFRYVLGRTTAKPIAADEMLQWSDLL